MGGESRGDRPLAMCGLRTLLIHTFGLLHLCKGKRPARTHARTAQTRMTPTKRHGPQTQGTAQGLHQLVCIMHRPRTVRRRGTLARCSPRSAVHARPRAINNTPAHGLRAHRSRINVCCGPHPQVWPPPPRPLAHNPPHPIHGSQVVRTCRNGWVMVSSSALTSCSRYSMTTKTACFGLMTTSRT